MTPLAALAVAAVAAGAGWAAFVRKPRSASLPSAFAPSQYTPPLLTPEVTGLKAGDVVLTRTPQPNQSLADTTVEITQVLPGGMYAVKGRPDLDGYDLSWGVVYPSAVGSGDIIQQEGTTNAAVAGAGMSIGAESAIRARHRARQKRGARK